jgi:hypothetical protein
MALVRIEFVRPWRSYAPGDQIEPNGLLREILLSGRNPYCKTVSENPVVETVTESQSVEKAVKPRGRKGKKHDVASESL